MINLNMKQVIQCKIMISVLTTKKLLKKNKRKMAKKLNKNHLKSPMKTLKKLTKIRTRKVTTVKLKNKLTMTILNFIMILTPKTINIKMTHNIKKKFQKTKALHLIRTTNLLALLMVFQYPAFTLKTKKKLNFITCSTLQKKVKIQLTLNPMK